MSAVSGHVVVLYFRVTVVAAVVVTLAAAVAFVVPLFLPRSVRDVDKLHVAPRDVGVLGRLTGTCASLRRALIRALHRVW